MSLRKRARSKKAHDARSNQEPESEDDPLPTDEDWAGMAAFSSFVGVFTPSPPRSRMHLNGTSKNDQKSRTLRRRITPSSRTTCTKRHFSRSASIIHAVYIELPLFLTVGAQETLLNHGSIGSVSFAASARRYTRIIRTASVSIFSNGTRTHRISVAPGLDQCSVVLRRKGRRGCYQVIVRH